MLHIYNEESNLPFQIEEDFNIWAGDRLTIDTTVCLKHDSGDADAYDFSYDWDFSEGITVEQVIKEVL